MPLALMAPIDYDVGVLSVCGYLCVCNLALEIDIKKKKRESNVVTCRLNHAVMAQVVPK